MSPFRVLRCVYSAMALTLGLGDGGVVPVVDEVAHVFHDLPDVMVPVIDRHDSVVIHNITRHKTSLTLKIHLVCVRLITTSHNTP